MDRNANNQYAKGLSFSIVPSTFAEDLDKSLFPKPSAYVSETAKIKTLSVYNDLKSVRKAFKVRFFFCGPFLCSDLAVFDLLDCQ